MRLLFYNFMTTIVLLNVILNKFCFGTSCDMPRTFLHLTFKPMPTTTFAVGRTRRYCNTGYDQSQGWRLQHSSELAQSSNEIASRQKLIRNRTIRKSRSDGHSWWYCNTGTVGTTNLRRRPRSPIFLSITTLPNIYSYALQVVWDPRSCSRLHSERTSSELLSFGIFRIWSRLKFKNLTDERGSLARSANENLTFASPSRKQQCILLFVVSHAAAM